MDSQVASLNSIVSQYSNMSIDAPMYGAMHVMNMVTDMYVANVCG